MKGFPMVTSSTEFASVSRYKINAKVVRLVESGRAQATEVLTRIANDHIADQVIQVGARVPERSRMDIGLDESSHSVMLHTPDDQWRAMHPHATYQLATRMDIPGGWAKNMADGADWQKDSIADVLTTHLAHTKKRDRFLVRSVGDQVRGVLSDRYRRLSSPIIANHFGEACLDVGAVPFKATMNDLRWSVSAMLPTPIEVKTTAHGVEYVAASVRLANSDYGMGRLDMAFQILRLICINGMIGDSVMREIHLGGRLPENIRVSEETYQKDSETQALLVRDAVAGLLTEKTIRDKVEKVEAAASNEVDAEETVKGLVRAKRIGKTEAQKVTAALVNRNGIDVPAGPVTSWSVAQALSWVAHEAPNGRSEELEKEAAKIIEKAAA